MRRLQREADAEEARAYKTLSAEVGKGKGRSSGRAAPKKDRKAHNQDHGKEAEVCTEGMGPEQVPRFGTGAHLAWVARNARKLKEACRSGGSGNKGNEKGNGKEEGKHLEELKRDVKKTREAVEETRSRLAEADGAVEAARQAYQAAMLAYLSHEGMGIGSKKGNAAVAAATSLGEGTESRIVDIPLNKRWGARGEIEPLRMIEERLSEGTCGWC